tara:strand:- start:1051 stop:1449 length:399 start_codon:yes stop_codon:yes gene_type:complete
MKIRIKIVDNDINTVAKVVIVDDKNRVLLLKRSNYTEKFSGQWDLPGGHLKSNESLSAGLEREVSEETGLTVSDFKLVEIDTNLHFFVSRYDSQPVKLSHEHTEYRFFDEKDLDPSQKFQKVAIKALGMIND